MELEIRKIRIQDAVSSEQENREWSRGVSH